METAKIFDDEWTLEGDELPYLKSLQLTAYRFTGDPDTAEDLVQETYLKAYRHFDQFKKGTNLRAWLFMILKNSFINHYRKKSFESYRTRPSDVDIETMPAGSLFPEAGLPMDGSDLELDDEVREAMDSLPEEYRTMVVLKDLNQYSYKEIAHLAKVPVGTVMSRLYRGRKLLEKALMSYGRRKGYLRNHAVAKRRDKAIPAA